MNELELFVLKEANVSPDSVVLKPGQDVFDYIKELQNTPVFSVTNLYLANQ